jgi:predicted DNA-binding protein YlxM (UPF0122 family)
MMGDNKQNLTYDNLSKKQLNAISYFVNPEIDSITKIAERAGVSRQTIYDWMDDEEFKQVLNKKIDKYVDSQTAHVWKSLIAQAKQGNVQAAKLFFEMQGKYRDRKEISGPDGEPIEINAKEELAKAINRVAEREEV